MVTGEKGAIEKCAMCGIRINPINESEIHFKDGVVKKYCCIHCASMVYYIKKADVDFVLVTDEQSGEKVNALGDALYIKSNILACEPCGIKVHVFRASPGGLDRAQKYIEDFGGDYIENPLVEPMPMKILR